MPGKTVGIALDLGYPGSISRSSDNVIVNRISAGVIPFGVAVARNPDNTVVAFGETHADADFIGIAGRIVKQQTDIFSPMGGYKSMEPVDIIARGDVPVAFNGTGTPVAGGAVYIRVAENTAFPNAAIGDFEAQADGANTILLENVRFTTGRTDANGVVEITVLTRRI